MGRYSVSHVIVDVSYNDNRDRGPPLLNRGTQDLQMMCIDTVTLPWFLE
jgi:hypothetical protein